MTMSTLAVIGSRLLLPVLVLLATESAVAAAAPQRVTFAKHRKTYNNIRNSIPKLRHGAAQHFDFGRFQSPDAIQKALSSCRHTSKFKSYRSSKDGRHGQICSTRLGGDWVLAESKQIAPSACPEEVLEAYLDGPNQKRWNADKLIDIRITRTGRGRYKQDMVLKSQRVITSHTGVMRYTQLIQVDKIGKANYNAFVRLDPTSKYNTAKRPFDSLMVNVCMTQVGNDVHIYAAGIMNVNRSVVPNLRIFDAR